MTFLLIYLLHVLSLSSKANSQMTRMLISALFIILSYVGHSQGIQDILVQTDYTKAVTRAASENKMLFIYFYVTDCEPCEQVAKSFKNKSIQTLYNDHYVSISLNANREGKTIAQNYGVFSYPTLLYVTPKEEIKFSARGYRDGRSIFNIGKLAQLPHFKIRKILHDKYESDPSNTDHLYDYIEYLYVNGRYSKSEKLLCAYLDQKDSIDQTSWMALVLDYATDPLSCANKALIQEKELFSEELGSEYIDQLIWKSLITKVMLKTDPSQPSLFERKLIQEAVDVGYDSNDNSFVLFCSEYFLLSNELRETGMPSKDLAIYTKYALKALNIEDHTFNREHILAIGVHLITFHQKKEALMQLIKVLDKNFKSEPHYVYLDLQSVALYILGKEEEAVSKIVRARELALRNGDVDYKPSINIFKKLGVVN